MRVTIKYKDLTGKLLEVMTVEQLIMVKNQIVKEFEALRDDSWQARSKKQELMAQAGIICGIISDKSKLIKNQCEKCGELTDFSGNMCEGCFDKEVDRYYDGGLDENE